MLQDTEIACRLAAVVAGPKVHLVGVSWGGKLATAYAAWARRGVEIASLTLVAPGIVPRVD
ncbi:MAG TPA: hypothetical protein DCX07_00665, partial [Phycisphaerales bacterium]|nr:hypothetical protein [Phycisphaerales bacterium]